MANRPACASCDLSLSHVLQAIGLSDERIQSSLRAGIGRFNVSIEDIRALLAPRSKKLAGAIAGRALYDGRLDAMEALRLVRAARTAT